MNKLVSIIIPTYKRPETLSRAINSVLNQTYRPIEIFVVDDNDPNTEYRESTEMVMKGYVNNPLITYIKHEKNKNGSAARNTGARYSKGAYLAFLDDDDEYLPTKIEAQVNRLEELNSSWGICYSRYYRKCGNKIISVSGETREGNVWFYELCRNFWHGGGTGPLVRRKVFMEVGGFDESFERNQDYEYMIKITKKYKLAFVDNIGHVCYVDAYHEIKQSYDMILNNFIKTFQKEIDTLPANDKVRFNRMIGLQSIRQYLFSEHDILKSYKVMKENNISIYLALKYICHLIYRKIFKISCGFDI